MTSTSSYNEAFANQVSRLVIEKYNKLPKTGKPNVNESQWTLLSGICLEENGQLSVVALATGTKCLGVTSYSRHGDVLHDSHAEIVVLPRIVPRTFLPEMLVTIVLSMNLVMIIPLKTILPKAVPRTMPKPSFTIAPRKTLSSIIPRKTLTSTILPRTVPKTLPNTAPIIAPITVLTKTVLKSLLPGSFSNRTSSFISTRATPRAVMRLYSRVM
ncbi:hypothetical protein M8J75_010308 [Diaphorina citri]|nr:hypothetical protein M8J75_010308 [Diaphorina citri]